MKNALNKMFRAGEMSDGFAVHKPEAIPQKCLEQLHVQGIFIKRVTVTLYGYKNKSSEMAIHFRA